MWMGVAFEYEASALMVEYKRCSEAKHRMLLTEL